tara:strand:+ start:22584 stop:23999 length:1416 start_codon:yes stop_codon:yes gene_type:complete
MALIDQTGLENAAVDAATLADVVNDPTGPFTTRLGQQINLSLAEAIDAITDFSAGVQFTFDPSITMSDPGSGDIRLDNATLSSVTQIAISDTDKNANDVSAFVNSFADSTSADKGTIRIMTTNSNVAYYNVTGVTNNTGWTLVDVDYYSSSGSFSSGEKTFLSFSRTGDAGGLTSGGINTYTGSNTFEGAFALNGNQSQSIVSQTDDFSLDATTNVLQIDLTGDQTLTGMTGGVPGRVVVISNVDATDSLTISHLSTSTATNQFDLPGNVDFVLRAGRSAIFKYASSKWVPLHQLVSEEPPDPFSSKEVGEIFSVSTHLTGVTEPNNDGVKKFIKLTIGLTGSGQFNEGLLINESTSGVSPLVIATADINVGPLSGETVSLLNTEGRYIKPGTSSGTIANDQMQGHWHDIVTGISTTSSAVSLGTDSDTAQYRGVDDAVRDAKTDGVNGAPRTGTSTDVKHMQAEFFMRVL